MKSIKLLSKFNLCEKKMILIFEPQCIGFEHAEFNAAFIKVIEKSSDDEILFIAEKDHIKNVESLLGVTEQINFKEIEVPPKEQSNMGRFRQEFGLTKDVFYLADTIGCNQIIFSSIKSPSLIVAKYYLRKFKSINVLIVPHSIIDSIYKIPLSRDIIFWFNFWFRFFNTPQLKYLLLGKTIKDELVKELPEMEKYFEYIDHPLLFKNYEVDDNHFGKKIVFGFLGVGYRKKGIGDFIKLSEDIKEEYGEDRTNFILVGHIPEDDFKIEDNFPITASKTPLNQADYNKCLEKINYALFFHKAEDYRFTASGAFFDAISYIKPIIAIKNPFLDYYFNLMGDIGYLCENYDEMRDTIFNIIKNPPKERYKQQQLNILQGREKISIEKIAEKFASIK